MMTVVTRGSPAGGRTFQFPSSNRSRSTTDTPPHSYAARLTRLLSWRQTTITSYYRVEGAYRVAGRACILPC